MVVFFDTEDDYAQGDATLNAMPTGDTPGRRASVAKYDVAIRKRPNRPPPPSHTSTPQLQA